MKTRTAVPAAAVLLVLMLAGCNASPRAQWAVARSTLTTTERALVDANRNGLLNDRAFLATSPWIIATRNALAEADKELTANGENVTDASSYYIRLANAALSSIKTIPPKR